MFDWRVLLTELCHRTGVKKIGHPSVDKAPSGAAEAPADPSKKRKGDEVGAPAGDAKRTKGDEVITISDEPAFAPSETPFEVDVALNAMQDAESQRAGLTAS